MGFTHSHAERRFPERPKTSRIFKIDENFKIPPCYSEDEEMRKNRKEDLVME
jgi:hypothetical protein